MSWRDLMEAPAQTGASAPPKPYPQNPHNPQNSSRGWRGWTPKPDPQNPHNPHNSTDGRREAYPQKRSPKSPQSPELPKQGGKSNSGDIGDQISTPAPLPAEKPAATPSPSCEAWEERAAILEHDGGLSRAEAEDQATCRRWLIHLPDGWRDSTFTPPASMADLRRWHPAALALVPADDDADPWGGEDDPAGAEPGHPQGEDTAAFYADLFRGMDAPRAYVTLGQAEIHAAVVAGLIRPEDTRGAVILAYRDPAGSCALLAIPQGQWDPFAVLALMDGPGTLH